MRQSDLLQHIRSSNPIVHCITNIVVANFQANGLLALGASPIMADSVEEAADVAAFSSCTLLNIGTLNPTTVDAMIAAGKSATSFDRPLLLDPVGAGATDFRKQTVQKLLEALDITLIRGNAGEIAAIADVEWNAKGVDAGAGDADISEAAQHVARKHNCLVAVTGEVDLVTDGKTIIHISGGHELMTQVTGTGCLLSAVVGAFVAVSEKQEMLFAAAEGLAFYKKAGEIAASQSTGPGDFSVHFLNTLYSLNPEEVLDRQFQLEEKVMK